jgi:hypothetical protein
MIIADLDRANARIVALEHRNVRSEHLSCLLAALIPYKGNSACRDWDYARRRWRFRAVKSWLPIFLLSHWRCDSVKSLELQIHELESETESLSSSLDHQKTRTSEVEGAGQKRAEELLKEVQKKVRFNLHNSVAKIKFELVRRNWAATEQTKATKWLRWNKAGTRNHEGERVASPCSVFISHLLGSMLNFRALKLGMKKSWTHLQNSCLYQVLTLKKP